MTRELEAEADLVLMPYNYLLDPSIRRQMKLDLNNCVIILDEAHNVENICADAASFDLDAGCVTGCIRDVDRCVNYLETSRVESNVSLDELFLLKSLLGFSFLFRPHSTH